MQFFSRQGKELIFRNNNETLVLSFNFQKHIAGIYLLAYNDYVWINLLWAG